MRLAYICYSLCDDIELNIKRAQEYCSFASNCGVIPLEPHTIANSMGDSTSVQREYIQELDRELAIRCDDVWIMGDRFSKEMNQKILLAKRNYIPCLYISDNYIQAGGKIRQQNEPFPYSYALHPENQDYTNEILVLKEDAYGKSTRITADDSLWIAKHGEGCIPDSSNAIIYADNLLTGKRVQWKRSDFHGIVDAAYLHCWLCDKPIKNEYAKERVQIWKEIQEEIYRSVDRELEWGMEP